MNNTRGYEIKFEAKQIVITKRFEKAANNYGTATFLSSRERPSPSSATALRDTPMPLTSRIRA